MKRIFAVTILFVVLMTVLATSVSAVSTSEMIEKLYQMGQPYGMTSADKVKMERFFADNPVTEAQADQIIAKGEEAVALMQAAGTTNYKELTTEQKNQLKSIANEAASIVGVSLVFKAGTVEIYKDGVLVETITSNNGTLAYTGNTTNMILVVSSVAIIALAATAVARRRAVNA